VSTIVFPDRAGARSSPFQEALTRAATAAAKAPSIGRGRALRWRISGARADLFVGADHLDPTVIIDGGSALHHACVALAGQGAVATWERFPGSPDGAPIAAVLVTGSAAPDPGQARAYQTISLPPVAAPPGRSDVPSRAVELMRQAVAERGAHLTLSMSGRSDVVRGAVAAELAGPPGWLQVGEALSALTLAGVMERLSVRACASPDGAAGDVLVEIGVPGRE
jgi:hypothetical protein